MLVHLRHGSETDACVPGAHVDCITAGGPHRRVPLDPYEAPSHAHELFCRYCMERDCWPRPKACSGSCPLQAPIASLGEGLGLSPPSGSSGAGGRAVSGSYSSKAVWAACLPSLTSLPTFCWAFLELLVTASCAASVSASGAIEARPPMHLDHIPTMFSRRFLASLPSLPPMWLESPSRCTSELGNDVRFRDPPPHSVS